MTAFGWHIERRASFLGGAWRAVDRLHFLAPFARGAERHWLHEIRDRLSQLEFLRERALASQTAWQQNGSAWERLGSRPGTNIRTLDELADKTEAAGREAILFAELFYVLAFRVVDAIRDQNAALGVPHTLVGEPVGVRRIRNDLIVHSTNKGKKDKSKAVHNITNRAFEVSADGRGVVMTGYRADGTSTPADPGFAANAEEFRSFILDWCDTLTAKVGVITAHGA